MDIKKIKALASIIRSSDLNMIEVSEGDSKIRLERSNNDTILRQGNAAPKINITEETVKPQEKNNIAASVDFNKISEVKSPMVGVFYSSPSPEKPPFVKIGDRVKKGSVLCIIEAMKLMNEICAEFDGEIVDICAQNEQIVEYGQTLFKIF